MKKTLVAMGLAAAIACGSSAGDMMENAFDGMTDVPDAGAQTGECPCEAGPPVVFCAEFGAFCGFSGGTFDSMTACRDAFSQFDDAALVCAVRSIEAAKSGDSDGCVAIAGPDPCGFTPSPKKPVIADTFVLPWETVLARSQFADVWSCAFHSTAVQVDDGQQLMMIAPVNIQNYSATLWNPPAGVGFAIREAGDTSDGEMILVLALGDAPAYAGSILTDLVGTTAPLTSGSYELGVCARHSQSMPDGQTTIDTGGGVVGLPISVIVFNPAE